MHINGIQKTGTEEPVQRVGRDAVIENRFVDTEWEGEDGMN